MNIVFITSLSGKISAGPSWSEPAKIKAQGTIDNVLWINTTNAEMSHWKEILSFHKMSEIGGLALNKLPKPFNKPDIVVCEGFYSMDQIKFAKTLHKVGVPYIIVPRGSLTRVSRNNKSRTKKRIAHLLWFNRFVRNASAIQYLTKQEKEDSISTNNKYFILPNGFNIPSIYKKEFSSKTIKCVFIGRIDIYQKGLDMLIDAIAKMQSKLRDSSFSFELYGPINQDCEILTKSIMNLGIGDLVSVKGEVSGIEKERVLLSADLFMLTSRSEGHPMGLIEALAYGLPCLVTRGSNMEEEIKKNDAGWTCGDSNVNNICEVFGTIMSEKQLLKDKSRNARNLAQEYNWDTLAQKFHQELLKLI